MGDTDEEAQPSAKAGSGLEPDADPEAVALRDAEAKRIGARLRAARRALGLTQQEMADRLGVHAKTYPKWESGERVRSWTRLIAASEACDTSPNAILGYAEGEAAEAAVRTALDPEAFGAALEAVAHLSVTRAGGDEGVTADGAFWAAMGGAFVEVIALTVRGAGAKEARAFLDAMPDLARG